ncbi:MAG: outer membrane protein assembly factor BamE [Sphingomonadaceae bacterium]
MLSGNRIAVLVLAMAAGALGGCSTIKENQGYIADKTLTDSIQPGIDNQASVQGTLGRPSFTSQYGQPTWYYVSSMTERKPFVRPRITSENVLAVKFDANGNVIGTERTGMEKVVYLRPDGETTPTLGRERSFLEDLFGNIGAVGAASPGAGGGR